MINLFDQNDTKEVISRINALTTSSRGLWGKMSVDQMLAHCNVSYEMVYDDIHPKPNFLKKFMLRLIVKPLVVGEKSYPKNARTAPAFLITKQKDFDKEKKRLINHVIKTQELGADHFDNKESHSFGPLTGKEWNAMFYKHLDHHLRQFGV